MKPCGLCPTTRDSVETALRKDAKLAIRVSATDKADMQAAAKALRLTLTDYIVRLHQFAKERA